jgi:ATP-dependent RNA helicase RhlE
MKFKDLPLAPIFLKAIAAQGYEEPTPIQQKAIVPALEGRDLVAVAQTGTGKTAAFALPALQWLYDTPPPPSKNNKKAIRCLVLSPTRELASQIEDGFKAYGQGTDFRTQVIFGGVNQNPQVKKLRQGIDILVATPGRLLDLMRQGHVNLNSVKIFILDEADRMLDMGFINDMKAVMAKLPQEKQTLLFSATMPEDINRLAKRFLNKPVRIEVTPPATTVEKIDQALFYGDKRDKRSLLIHLLENHNSEKALVFTRTKHGANRVAEQLGKSKISAAAIHGNKSQGARERALKQFKSGELQVLVATDIAARGIDVEGVTHVIQLDLPEVAEQYVHRIGRTARAGASGVAWAFCSIDQRGLLTSIERTIKMKITVIDDHPFPAKDTTEDLMREEGEHKPRRSPNQRSRFSKGGRGPQSKTNRSSSTRQNKHGPSKNANSGKRPASSRGAARQR